MMATQRRKESFWFRYCVHCAYRRAGDFIVALIPLCHFVAKLPGKFS